MATKNTVHLIAALARYAAHLDKDGDQFGGHISIDHRAGDWHVTLFSDYPLTNPDNHFTWHRGQTWTIEARSADLDTALQDVIDRAATEIPAAAAPTSTPTEKVPS